MPTPPFRNFWAAFLEASVQRPNCASLVQEMLTTSDSINCAKAVLRGALARSLRETPDEPILQTHIHGIGPAVVSYTSMGDGYRVPVVWIDHVMVNGVDVIGQLSAAQVTQLENEAREHHQSGGDEWEASLDQWADWKMDDMRAEG